MAVADSVLPAARQAGIAPIAVIDVGSNSVRLVVFSGPARAPTPMFNEKVLCGLGRGLSDTGRLHEEGVVQALAALKRFVTLARLMNVADIQVVATAAARDAANGAHFVVQVERKAGVPVRILTGHEEAELSALGVLSGIPDAHGLMGDLGGGSLEVVGLDRGTIGQMATLPLGPLRLASIGKGDDLRDHIDEQLKLAGWIGRLKGRTLYLVGGAWRNIARVHMTQTDYPLRIIHHYGMAMDQVEELTRLLSKQSRESLARLGGVSRRRQEVLPVAALVLRRLVRAMQPKDVVFSAHGLREGLVHAGLGAAQRREDPLLVAAREVGLRENRFGERSAELESFTLPLFPDETPADRRLRLAACMLADAAWRIHPDHRGEYVLSRVLNEPFVAIDHHERVALAVSLYARYTGQAFTQDTARYVALLDDAGLRRAHRVGSALRLAQTLSGGVTGVLASTRLKLTPGAVILEVPAAVAPLMTDEVERRLEGVAQAFGRARELKLLAGPRR